MTRRREVGYAEQTLRLTLSFAALALASLPSLARGQTVVLAPPPASAPSDIVTSLEGRSLHVTTMMATGPESLTLDLGCEGRSVLRAGDAIYVACGAAGVVVVALSAKEQPRVARTVPFDGEANALFVHDGRVWVETSRVEAHPLDEPRAPIDAAQRAVPLATAQQAPAEPSGVYDATWKERLEKRRERYAILSPERRGGISSASIGATVFLAVGQLGVGAFLWLTAEHRFSVPLAIRAKLAPLGFGTPSQTYVNDGSFTSSASGPVAVTSGYGVLALDTRFFEVGFGGGGATVNTPTVGYAYPNAPPPETTSSPTLVAEARVGARDGLYGEIEGVFVVDQGKFQVGSITSHMTVPLVKNYWLVAGGGGGNIGFAVGDVGVRTLVRGDGGAGTIAVTGAVGGAHVGLSFCSSNPDPPFTSSCRKADLNGPAISASIEARF